MRGETERDPTPTVVLVERAKGGDSRAWDQLIERYYNLWLGKYHGKLGRVVHRFYDTQALVQSAIADAMRDLRDLRNDHVFFSWVTSIIRHKLAKKRSRLEREEAPGARPRDPGAFPDRDGETPEEKVSATDTYLRTLDAMLALFPQHAEEMAAVYLRFLEGCSVPEVVERLGRPRRTVYRWLRDGTTRLQRRLSP